MRVSALSAQGQFLLVRSRIFHELGPDASCEACGTTEPLVLARVHESVVCRECEAVRRGASPFQMHHIGGRAPGTRTVLVGANLHAIFSLLQVCFWQGRHEPGSSYAVAFDLAVYLAHMSGEVPEL